MINNVRIERFRFGNFHGSSIRIQLLEEATNMSRVAGGDVLPNLEKQGVAVAIYKPADDGLRVSAALAFEPRFLPRPAPVMHFAGGERVRDRLFIHPRHHEHTTRRNRRVAGFLDNGRDEAVGVVFEIHKEEK